MGMTPDEWKTQMLKAIKAREPMLEDAQQKVRNAEDDALRRRPVGVSSKEMYADDSDVQHARERLATEESQQQVIRDEAEAKTKQYEHDKAAIQAKLKKSTKDLAAAKKVAESPAPLTAALKLVVDHVAANDFSDAERAFTALQVLIATTRKDGVKREHDAKKAAERALFERAIPDLENFDTYENIQEQAPEQIEALNATFDAMLTRANELGAAGASLDEQKAMLAHIPENFWPDRFFTELEAWRITEAAFLDEAVGKLFEAAKEEESTAEKAEKGAETAKGLAETAAKAKPKDDDTEAFLAAARKDFATAAEDVAMAAEVGGIVAGIVAGRGKERTPEETVKIGLERTKAIASVSTGILDQLAEHFESVEQLQAAKAVIDILNGVNGPVIDMASSFIDAGTADEASQDTTKNAQERLKAQQEYEAALWKAVSAAAATGVSVTKVLLPLAGEVGKQVTPILGVPSNGIAVVKSVKEAIERGMLRSQTGELGEEAAATDPRYTRMIQQEMASLNKGIAKATVNAIGNTVEAVGSVTAAAGAAPVGGAIAIVGKVITYGGKAVFFVVDTAQAKQCEATLKRARAGDREARKEIFANSGRYAKMFIAIGATKTPPDEIAVKFVTQRGMTDADLNDSSTGTFVVRQYLLTKSGEKDGHETILDTIGEAASAVKRKVGDVLSGVDRSIAYGDEQKKWKPSTIRFTGSWWLKTEADAVKNGLDYDTIDGLQGAFSNFESSKGIAEQNNDAARWADHFEAARTLQRRVIGFSPRTNSKESHVAMETCRSELLDQLNRIVSDLQAKIDPAETARQDEAIREACGTMLVKAKDQMVELGVVDTWLPKANQASELLMTDKNVEAMALLESVLGSLQTERLKQAAATAS